MKKNEREINIEQLAEAKEIKVVAQEKGNQRKEPGQSPGKPHYLKLTLKLQV